MRKLLQNKTVVSALAIIAVASVAANFVKLPHLHFRTVNARTPAHAAPIEVEGQYHIPGPAFASLAAQPWRELYPIDASARDPFAPTVVPPPVAEPISKRDEPSLPPVFQLQATSLGGREPYAVINHAILREGESVSGYRVEQIHPRQVRLSGPSGSLVLDLNPNTPPPKPPTERAANADLPAALGGPPSARTKP